MVCIMDGWVSGAAILFCSKRWDSPAPAANNQLICRAMCMQGENVSKDGFNAIHVASTPCTDALRDVPKRWRTIKAHGVAVGLPSDDDMGNSEVSRLFTRDSMYLSLTP